MAPPRAHAPTSHRPLSPITWIGRRLSRSGSERGQALVITAAAMFVVLMMAAFSIDLASWYQKHHQAQVAADAGALAAANCLAHEGSASTCKTATDTTDAGNVATTIATTNLPTSTNQVTVNTTSHTVTVTSSASGQVDFAGLVSLHPTVSARSVAGYTAAGLPFSVFVGNDAYNSASSPCNTNANAGLQVLSSGGGNALISGLYSDSVINNGNDANDSYSGGISDGLTTGGMNNTTTNPLCGTSGDGQTDSAGSGGTGNGWLSKNTTLAVGQETAYPIQYTPPSIVSGTTITSTYPSSPPTTMPGVCTFASTYFSTDGTGMHQIRWPGTYCVIASVGSTSVSTSYSGTSCTTGSTTDDTSGSIYLGGSVNDGAYEFAAPCVVADKGSLTSGIQGINALNPVIYGTAQAASPCLSPPNNFVNPSAIVYSIGVEIYWNNVTMNGPIYAPCSTVDLNKNNNYDAFVEAANVIMQKNNWSAFTGTGPLSAPGSDGLSG